MKKGFTVAEMMVAMAVMSVILLITIAFFRFQSQMSGTTTKERSGRQNVTLALTALQRDILQAGYGVARYPQLAFMFGNNWNVNTTHLNQDRLDPRYNSPVYGTLWINYGQYLKSSIPYMPNQGTSQYAKWPSLVYNLQPLSNNDVVGGTFYIPAADDPAKYPVTPEASANANNIGAIIVWPSAPTGFETNRAATPVTQPGVVPAPVTVGQTNKNPPTGIVTQFQVPSPPGGLFWFAPAIVYNFVPGDPNAHPPTLGTITRNQDPNQTQVQSTFLGDRSLVIIDFQVRAFYNSGAAQAWMPDAGTLPTGFGASSLRYIETRIVYKILDPSAASANAQVQVADVQAGEIFSVTRTMRVTPRTVVLSSY